jgi:hypothetical protein
MNVDNFNWFLHSLLFLHTQHVINKQKEKERKRIDEDEDEDEDEDDGIDIEQED